jgi:hypothetical protein
MLYYHSEKNEKNPIITKLQKHFWNSRINVWSLQGLFIIGANSLNIFKYKIVKCNNVIRKFYDFLKLINENILRIFF